MLTNFLNLLLGNFGSTIVAVFTIMGAVVGVVLTVVFVMALFFFVVRIGRNAIS